MSGDLFQSTAFNELKDKGFPVVTRERVVVDTYVTVDGINFELEDLMETLEAVQSNDAYTSFSTEKFAVLHKNGILLSQSRRDWAATPGPNLDEFLEILYKLEAN